MPLIPPKHFTPGTGVGNVLSWNGTAWVSAPAPSGFTPGGDLGGTSVNQIVQGIQGVPFTDAATETGLTAVNVVEPTIPFTNPTGCVSDGSYLWVCDRTIPYIFRVDPENWYSALRINLNLPSMSASPTPTYLFVSEGYLICTASRDIFLIDPVLGTLVGYVRLSVESSYACFDSNLNLWVSSEEGVRHLSLSSILASFPEAAPTGIPVSLASTATSIIVGPYNMIWAGFGTLLYRIDPTDDTIETHTEAGCVHQYLFSAGGYIWVAQFGEGSNTILKYDPTTFPSAPLQIALDPTVEYPGWMVEFDGVLYIADNDIARLYTIDTLSSTYTGYITNGTEEWLNQVTYHPGEVDTLWVGVSQGRNGYASYPVGNPSLGDPTTSFSGGTRVRWEFPTIVPLSNVFYVDGGTNVLLDKQSGSIAQPFGLLNKAVGVIGSTPYPGPTLLIAPGDYSEESLLYWASPGNPPAAITFKGFGSEEQLAIIPGITGLSGNIACERVRVDGPIHGNAYVRLTKVSLSNNLRAGFVIAQDSMIGGDVYTNGGTFKNCTLDGNTIYALELASTDFDEIDTTLNDTLRIRSYPSDDYTEVVVTNSTATSIGIIVDELSAVLPGIGISVERNEDNQILFRSNTGLIEIDPVGSTLNLALDLVSGLQGPANIQMDSSTYGHFRMFQGIYRGPITLDNGKNYAAFRNPHSIGVGTDWHTLVAIPVPEFDTGMHVIDWTVSGNSSETEALLNKAHSLVRRLSSVTTIVDTVTELITPSSEGLTRAFVSGDFIYIQVLQNDLSDWTVQAEVFWVRL